jgi:hypothetical protein
MFEPVTLAVGGRGRLTATAQSSELGVAVRLDDAKRPDWWAEVRLPWAALRELLRQVERCQQAALADAPACCDSAPDAGGGCAVCGVIGPAGDGPRPAA